MTTYSKMQEKKDKLKKELLSKTEPKLGNDVLLNFREQGPAIQESEGVENTSMNNKVTLATQWTWKVEH